ncbi:uncharacterized protein HD556DRAFT_936293 [Suillus plorans]|uniref:Uncharacterized protein n=1 Tax=Suillus plorans TaxID=116603 RepID=A0A9P7AEF0_9AGAM|nr:uncharacterized protein HD556DRAFT_936293 [Suillus plorans]KAG1787737.1 hypothetical protein HD556DRAFT_936293 [Suillus plorans]
MQRHVLLSALISSFIILAAASPMPGAISKRSFERRELDTNFQRDLLEEDKKREELKTDFIIYAWYDGPGTGDKKRKELGSGIEYDGHD